jgi:hypothetical protein
MKEMNSQARRWPVVAAAVWALMWFGAVLSYHISEPVGVLSITIDGHTYWGNPPALTLYASERSWVLIMVVIVVGAMLVSAIDVTVRRLCKSGGPGIASAIVGALLVVFSFFGLLWGWRPSAS